MPVLRSRWKKIKISGSILERSGKEVAKVRRNGPLSASDLAAPERTFMDAGLGGPRSSYEHRPMADLGFRDVMLGARPGRFRAEATRTAAKVPQSHWNPPAAIRVGRSNGESRITYDS